MTAASTTTAFGTALSFNTNPNVNFLQATQAATAHQQQLPQAFLNANLIQQQQQSQPQPQQQPQQQSQVKDTTFTKIFVGGLPYHTTDESLSQFFQKFGNIEEAVVINDRQTGKSRGYGFVTMETKEAAEAAILDPNPIIDGRKANVNLAYLGVKSRIIAPTGIIPLGVRYQLPAAQTSPYGFHPFYYHPGQTVAPTPYSLNPNLLIPTQQSNNLIANPSQSTGIFDLHHMPALNSNRESPFESGMAATSGPNNFFNTTNHPSINTLISQNQAPASSAAYYAAALPPQINTVFQTQLHDRL